MKNNYLKEKKKGFITNINLGSGIKWVRDGWISVDKCHELTNDKRVLDLFSGVGTLGIEAMSRGAKEVVFVEKNYKIIKILKKNIERCNLMESSSIVKSDVLSYLDNENRTYDIIFADPPYRSYPFEEIFPKVSTLLNNNGIFCYESNKQNIDVEGLFKIKYYGNTQVVLWENKK